MNTQSYLQTSTCAEVQDCLLKLGWKQDTPSLLSYSTSDSARYLLVKLNLITNEHMTLTTVRKDQQHVQHYDLAVQDDSILQLQEKMEELNEEARMAKEFDQLQQDFRAEQHAFLKEKNAVYQAKKGAYLLTLPNGLQCYLSPIPNENGFDYTFLQSCETNSVGKVHHGYIKGSFTKLDWFKGYIADVEKRVPAKNGWINPLSEFDSTYCHSYLSFQQEILPHYDKAKVFRDILSDVLPEEWLYYLFVPRYVKTNLGKGRFELSFYPLEQWERGERIQMFLMLVSLMKTYPFLSVLFQENLMTCYEVNYSQATEEEMKRFARDLYEQASAILNEINETKNKGKKL